MHIQKSADIDNEVFKTKSAEANQAEPPPIHLQPTTVSSAQREERFNKALDQFNTKGKKNFDKSRIKTEKKALRMNEHQDEHSIKLENERKEFLKTLTDAKPISSSKKTN